MEEWRVTLTGENKAETENVSFPPTVYDICQNAMTFLTWILCNNFRFLQFHHQSVGSCEFFLSFSETYSISAAPRGDFIVTGGTYFI